MLRIVRCASPVSISFVFGDRNDGRITRMIGQLERSESRNYRKSRDDRTDSCFSILTDVIRRCGPKCWGSDLKRRTLGGPLGNVHYNSWYIPLFGVRSLLLKKSPIIWPILSRNGNTNLLRKRHVQKEKELWSPWSETTTQQSPSCWTPLFSIVQCTLSPLRRPVMVGLIRRRPTCWPLWAASR